MIIKRCCKCGATLVVYAKGKMPWLMSGAFCGCPFWPGKYKKTVVSDGVLVVADEVAL